MAQFAQLPDGSYVQFPDNWSEKQMDEVVYRDFANQFPDRAEEKAPGFIDTLLSADNAKAAGGTMLGLASDVKDVAGGTADLVSQIFSQATQPTVDSVSGAQPQVATGADVAPAQNKLGASTPILEALGMPLQNLPDVGKNVMGGLMQTQEDPTPYTKGLLAEGKPGAMDATKAIIQMLTSGEGLSLMTQPFLGKELDKAREVVAGTGKVISDQATKDIAANQPKGLGAPAQLAYDVVRGITEMAPAYGAAYLTKNPAMVPAIMGTQVKGQNYQESRAMGLEPYKAKARSDFNVLAEGLPEYIPALAILEKGGPLKKLFLGSLGEGAQEMVTEVLQNTYDKVALERMSLKDAIAGIDWGKVLYAGAVGVGAGAGVSTAVSGLDAAGNKMADRAAEKAHEAKIDEALHNIAAAQATQQLSPDRAPFRNSEGKLATPIDPKYTTRTAEDVGPAASGKTAQVNAEQVQAEAQAKADVQEASTKLGGKASGAQTLTEGEAFAEEQKILADRKEAIARIQRAKETDTAYKQRMILLDQEKEKDRAEAEVLRAKHETRMQNKAEEEKRAQKAALEKANKGAEQPNVMQQAFSKALDEQLAAEMQALPAEKPAVAETAAKADTKPVTLTHYSKAPNLTEIDPSFHGTGVSGQESKRKATNPDTWVDRSYFYMDDGGAGRKDVMLGKEQYQTQVNEADLYDFRADPDGLKEAAMWGPKLDLTLYEKNIKEAGYKGYWTDTPEQGRVAAVFEKTPVTSTTTPSGASTETIDLAKGIIGSPKNYDIARRIDDAARLAIVGAATRVDDAFRNTSERFVSDKDAQDGDALYKAFAPVRDQLRKEYGDSVPLVRLDAPEDIKTDKKTTLNYSLAADADVWEDFYKGDNRERVQIDVPIDDIVAVNVGADGKYPAEFIVLNRRSPQLRDPVTPTTTVADQIKENGGYSVNPKTNTAPTDGFMVSNRPDLERQIPLSKFTQADVDQYMKDNADALKEEGAHFGAWVENGDTVVLDVSQQYPSEQEALTSAVENDQRAIYDVKNGKDITTDSLIPESLKRQSGTGFEQTQKQKDTLPETLKPQSGAEVDPNFKSEPFKKNEDVFSMEGPAPKRSGGEVLPYVGREYKGERLKNFERDVEWVHVDDLLALRGNNLGKTDLSKLKKEIEAEGGLQEPVILSIGKDDRTAALGEGNHRVQAAKEMGYTWVPTRASVQRGNHGDRSYPRADIIPEAGEYFSADAKPSEVLSSLRVKSKPFEKGDKGFGTLSANPIPQMMKAWEALAQKAIDVWNNAVGWRYDTLGKLPAKQIYLAERYKVLGRIADVDGIAKEVYDVFRNASEEDQRAVYDYLTTPGATPNIVTDAAVRKKAVAVKRLINATGQALVDRGLLSDAAFQKNKDGYLPRTYLKYLVGDKVVAALTGGKKVSKMAWSKARQDIPADVRELILGEITDPAYLASKGLGTELRDIAIMDFLNWISDKNEWVDNSSLVEWEGRNVSAIWLELEAKQLEQQAAYYKDGPRQKALAIVEQMRNTIENQVPSKVDSKDYREVPVNKRYGRLQGMYVRKEIFDDLISTGQIMPNDANFWESWFGYGGTGTRVTQLWKLSKVALNPPAQIRNATSNMILLHLSGIPLAMVPVYVTKAVSDIKKNGRYWRLAKKHGVTESTFAAQELFRIERDLLDLESRLSGDGLSMARLKNVAGIIGEMAGDAYQFIEAVGKTAKIMHSMDQGKSADDAAMDAQKWLFDYSLVPSSVRTMRNMPLGVPFVTFYYKVLPRLLETAIKRPWAYLPYAALPSIMAAIFAEFNDVDDDDAKKLAKSLPMWLQDKGTALILPTKDPDGRWVALDFSYILPWSMFTSTANDLAEGELSRALKDTGIFGGPIGSIITAISTNVDSFTGNEIVPAGASPKEQVISRLAYMYNLAMPGWLTDTGFAGKMLNAINEDVNMNEGMGRTVLTPGQATMRLFGANLYPFNPEMSRGANIERMQREIEDIRADSRRRIKDAVNNKGNPEQRIQEINEDMVTRIQALSEEIGKYAEASEVPEKLTLDR